MQIIDSRQIEWKLCPWFPKKDTNADGVIDDKDDPIDDESGGSSGGGGHGSEDDGGGSSGGSGGGDDGGSTENPFGGNCKCGTFDAIQISEVELQNSLIQKIVDDRVNFNIINNINNISSTLYSKISLYRQPDTFYAKGDYARIKSDSSGYRHYYLENISEFGKTSSIDPLDVDSIINFDSGTKIPDGDIIWEVHDIRFTQHLEYPIQISSNGRFTFDTVTTKFDNSIVLNCTYVHANLADVATRSKTLDIHADKNLATAYGVWVQTNGESKELYIRNGFKLINNVLTITNATTIENNFIVKGTENITGTLTVGGVTTINSNTTINGALQTNGTITASQTMTAQTGIVSNNTIYAKSNITSDQTITGKVLISNTTLTVKTTSNLVGDVTMGGNVNIGKDVAISGTTRVSGDIYARKVYSAVWNDYAEFFERGEDTEPGDIIALDMNSNKEVYIKAKEGDTSIAGIHSDNYGSLIGGEDVPEGIDEDYDSYNLKKFIPVGLAGRLNVKFIGKAKKGEKVVVSEIPGVGRLYDDTKDNVFSIIGFLVEEDNRTDQRLLKIKISS